MVDLNCWTEEISSGAFTADNLALDWLSILWPCLDRFDDLRKHEKLNIFHGYFFFSKLNCDDHHERSESSNLLGTCKYCGNQVLGKTRHSINSAYKFIFVGHVEHRRFAFQNYGFFGPLPSSDKEEQAEHDKFVLNGEKMEISDRMRNCLISLRQERLKLEQPQSQMRKISDRPLLIESFNNFPTAAGLASSASGFACLVYSIAALFQLVPLSRDTEPSSDTLERLSMIARLGSGSACRSLFGGYVKWEMGSLPGGEDSRAVQVASKSHWPDMRVCILVVDDGKKEVSSTQGMQSTVHTSPLFPYRVQEIVPDRMREMSQAIRNRDFETFAELTMRDSNQFHALCMDTYPPIYYMNDTSRLIVRFVHVLNERCGRNVVAYTFDAGPNACLYYLDKDSDIVNSALKSLLKNNPSLLSDINCESEFESDISVATGGVKRVIWTRVGDGPKVISYQ